MYIYVYTCMRHLNLYPFTNFQEFKINVSLINKASNNFPLLKIQTRD